MEMMSRAPGSQLPDHLGYPLDSIRPRFRLWHRGCSKQPFVSHRVASNTERDVRTCPSGFESALTEVQHLLVTEGRCNKVRRTQLDVAPTPEMLE